MREIIGEQILNKSLMNWLGQVTTGHGVMVLAPTLLAVLAGTLSWHDATPLLVAGAIGLLWPENTALKADAGVLAADVADMVAAGLSKAR